MAGDVTTSFLPFALAGSVNVQPPAPVPFSLAPPTVAVH